MCSLNNLSLTLATTLIYYNILKVRALHAVIMVVDLLPHNGLDIVDVICVLNRLKSLLELQLSQVFP